MPGDAISGPTNEQTEHSLRIIVPKARLDLYRSLERTFGDDTKVLVILDRRLGDRRRRSDAHEPERRRGDRRRRAERDAELEAGRWVAVSWTSRQIDFLDPDARAILFLCCSEHVIPCQQCQNTYRLRSIRRGEAGLFPCPLCGNDLTPTVTAHVQTCRYWANRGNGEQEPVRRNPTEPGAEAAAG
jgi:hypothetical protein